jgi:hypothetical protein
MGTEFSSWVKLGLFSKVDKNHLGEIFPQTRNAFDFYVINHKGDGDGIMTAIYNPIKTLDLNFTIA